MTIFHNYFGGTSTENTWKEVVEKNNVAVAIVLAAFIIGISMIISAAIHG